jgi:predicted N-acetyltransferase YhbS
VPQISIRSYDHAADFDAVGRFLVEVYEPGRALANWLEPRWQYMHYHPFIEGLPLDLIGVVEEDGEMVGLVTFEHSPAFANFQTRPGHDHVKEAMFDYAVGRFGGWSHNLEREVLGVFLNEFDTTLINLAKSHGFTQMPEWDEPHSRFLLDRPVEVPPLPDGFRLQSLEDENDLRKINAVLWRGFDHEGPPPDGEIPGREHMQRAPGFRKDLTIVVVTPEGDYASFAGMWIVPENRLAYVEPVATDPEYRRMGLGAAAVLETLRRVADLGAEVAWVGSDQDFYHAIGFTTEFRNELWLRDR